MGRARLRLLFADAAGKVMEHPYLLATIRTGEELHPADGDAILLPPSGRLVQLPGRLPVGIHPRTGQWEVVREVTIAGRSFIPRSVGALLPPGYTRTALPGEVMANGPILPQWAYAAAAWGPQGAMVWGLRTDRRRHWDLTRFSTKQLPQVVADRLRESPTNRVLHQLKRCALVYRCVTSQNIFYGRDEGAIPASMACNARCVGCISEQPEDGPPASHERLRDGPSSEEMGDVGGRHLAEATGRTMVSFGQGCEGEPLTRYRQIASAIQSMRARTARGSININTNGSMPDALDALFRVDLDAVRISLNSAVKDLYEAYYQPIGYGWEDVEASIAVARKRRAYLALNLLTFPGVTDRQGEVEALAELVRKHRIDQVQTRSLCIDPMQYLKVAHARGGGGSAIGIAAMLNRLKKAWPRLIIGNFARGRNERKRWIDPNLCQ
jgi:wyosine [tRNA(Phe)-imidazoG37] synthetase (radical SAM superfamily)